MGMWNDLGGVVRRSAGTAGTLTLSNGGKITFLYVHGTSAGTVAIPNGMGGTTSITVIAGTSITWNVMHLNMIVAAGSAITFTGTDSYIVEWME